ncbi:hypothetical protein MVEN_01645300 [Mycena venus]|uniref:Uncharacterized protein n=1 Tax=Mycena venus TaxID=2733690 RepID=A0A8H6XQN4_9AGAR|nr:hypothetical protein MVEN_01645300 [Mycena venus]
MPKFTVFICQKAPSLQEPRQLPSAFTASEALDFCIPELISPIPSEGQAPVTAPLRKPAGSTSSPDTGKAGLATQAQTRSSGNTPPAGAPPKTTQPAVEVYISRTKQQAGAATAALSKLQSRQAQSSIQKVPTEPGPEKAAATQKKAASKTGSSKPKQQAAPELEEAEPMAPVQPAATHRKDNKKLTETAVASTSRKKSLKRKQADSSIQQPDSKKFKDAVDTAESDTESEWGYSKNPTVKQVKKKVPKDQEQKRRATLMKKQKVLLREGTPIPVTQEASLAHATCQHILQHPNLYGERRVDGIPAITKDALTAILEDSRSLSARTSR